MSRFCKITKKKPLVGNNRSHAMNANKRVFFPNLQWHRFWIEKEKKFIRIKLSTKGMRNINRVGIEKYLKIFKKK